MKSGWLNSFLDMVKRSFWVSRLAFDTIYRHMVFVCSLYRSCIVLRFCFPTMLGLRRAANFTLRFLYNCYPFVLSANPIFLKDLGLRTCAGFLNKRSKKGFMRIGHEYVVFDTLLVFWTCGRCNSFTKYRIIALESLTLRVNLVLNSSNKSRKSDQGCPREGQHRSNGVPHRGFE